MREGVSVSPLTAIARVIGSTVAPVSNATFAPKFTLKRARG